MPQTQLIYALGGPARPASAVSSALQGVARDCVFEASLLGFSLNLPWELEPAPRAQPVLLAALLKAAAQLVPCSWQHAQQPAL